MRTQVARQKGTSRRGTARIPGDERSVSDEEFLRALDLDRTGLGRVRRCIEREDLDGAKVALVEYFRRRLRPRWFFDVRDNPRGRVWSAWPGLQHNAVARAGALLRNRFMLGAKDESLAFDAGPDLKWRTSEMRQLASTAYALKRCNFLRDLAVAWRETGREVYAGKFAELLDRWLEDWPLVVEPVFSPRTAVLSGSDGHDTMTSAFRWFSWMDCLYSGILFAPQVPRASAFRLIKSMWFTALQYRHYETSPYVPANHHLFERGTAPFVFGVMLPEFPEVCRLVRQARPVIRKHAVDSFLRDGGYEERSTSYTVSALQMFLIPQRLASLNRLSLLHETARERVKRCVEMVSLIALPDGSQPDVGDGTAPASTTATIAGAAAALFRSRTAAESVRRLGLTRLVPEYDRSALRKQARTDLPLTVHYPRAGYFVARDGWTEQASAMVLSVPGPGLSNHAHDDALSLQLVVRGEPMVGTPVSELYGHAWRSKQASRQKLNGHLYAMTSHNVVLAGGQPLRSIDDLILSWGPDPTPVRTRWTEGNQSVRVRSAHDGYVQYKLAREVEFRHRRGWEVIDSVRGEPGKPHIARWHFEYGVEVAEDGDALVATRNSTALRILFEGQSRFRLYRDVRWLGRNPFRRGEPVPWVVDVHFGGSGHDRLVTRLDILRRRL